MAGETERETSRQRAMRLRSEARRLATQRALSADESEKGLDEMIRRSIDLHGA